MANQTVGRILFGLLLFVTFLAYSVDFLAGHRPVCLHPFGKVLEYGQYCSAADVPLNPHRITQDDLADLKGGS